MELRELETFVAVAERGGFTAAARRLGVAQSAVSTQIQRLETDLANALFDRTTRRVELTDAGHALLPEARRVLAAEQAARDAVEAVRGGLRGTIRLGSMHARAMGPIDLPAAMSRFREDCPQVEIHLLQGATSTEKLYQLLDAELELAIVGLEPPPPPGIRFENLWRTPMRLLCHRDHALGRASALDLGSLSGETFVDGPPGSASRETVDAAFAAIGATRRVAYEVNDTGGMLGIVQAQLAIVILPESVAVGQDDVVAVPISPDAPTFTVSLACATNRDPGAATKALIERFRIEAAATAEAG